MQLFKGVLEGRHDSFYYTVTVVLKQAFYKEVHFMKIPISMNVRTNNSANDNMITAGAGASVSNLGTMTATGAAAQGSNLMANLQA